MGPIIYRSPTLAPETSRPGARDGAFFDVEDADQTRIRSEFMNDACRYQFCHDDAPVTFWHLPAWFGVYRPAPFIGAAVSPVTRENTTACQTPTAMRGTSSIMTKAMIPLLRARYPTQLRCDRILEGPGRTLSSCSVAPLSRC